VAVVEDAAGKLWACGCRVELVVEDNREMVVDFKSDIIKMIQFRFEMS
jgi:hypothetical protein